MKVINFYKESFPEQIVNEKVLDIGCGGGITSFEASKPAGEEMDMPIRS